ncbi:NAD-dependent epimerase/dehydratase family protein [Candidatus Thioglobus sp.]|nr:NAD-dependent epimerase/dehydratase family protein [Candidatus Thioglobus sp.]
MTKYLVTGSTGFIGSRLLGLLNTIECDVRLLARSKVNNYETVVCNLEQDRISKHTLESIDAVFHLAGFAHDMQNPSKVEDLYRVINLDATVELAKLAVESGVKSFVFISSVKAGGSFASGKCNNESDQNEPEGVYGKSKREAELKLLKIGNESGMHVSIIRPSLVYGPEVKGNLQLMLSGIKAGWFPPLPETGNRRSMIHVDDLVQVILLVSEDRRANGEIFIATDGTPYSSREIYNAMCGVVGKTIPKWNLPKVLFKTASLISPHTKYKLNKLLGDECYSSAKLEALGFKAKKSLQDMNETDF